MNRFRTLLALTYLLIVNGSGTLWAQTNPAPTALAVSQVGNVGMELTWTDNATNEASFDVETSTDNRTFSRATDAPALPRTGRVTYRLTGLQPNTPYFIRVRARITATNQTAYVGPIQQRTNGAGPAPNNLSLGLQSNPIRVVLTWTDVVKEGSYDVEQRTNGGRWERIAGSGAGYEDRNVAENTNYCYRVRLAPSDIQTYPYSNEPCTTTPSSKPPAPTGLQARAVSTSEVDVSWTASTGTHDGTEVEYSQDNSRFQKFGGTVRVGTNQQRVSGLQAGTRYWFRVRATNGTNPPSDYTGSVEATTFAASPNIPLRLSASTQSDTQINLTWFDNSSNETAFEIQRREVTETNWTNLQNSPANPAGGNITYGSTNLKPSTRYCFRVRAVNGSLASDWTAEECATTNAPPVIAPEKPTNLVAAAQSSTEIKLTWTHNGANLTRFELQRSRTGNDPWENVDMNIPADRREKTDGERTPSTRYFYRVRAVLVTPAGTVFNSDWSDVKDATTQAPPQTAPRPPSSLGVAPQSHTAIKITWDDNSDNESRFEVWWATSQTATFTKLTDVEAGKREYIHTGLTPGTPYCYKVLAANNVGSSAFVGPGCNSTLPPPIVAPAPPTDFNANGTAGRIDLSWQDVATNETGYELQWSRNSGGPWESLALPNQGLNATAFAHTGLLPNTRYYYQLRAVNTVGQSAWVTANALVPALPIPSTTTDLQAKQSDYDRITLTWGAITNNPTSITVLRSDSPTGPFVPVGAVLAGNVLTFTDINLPEKTTFYYRIRSANANGTSGDSNIASAVTGEAIIAVRPLPLPEGMYAHVDQRTQTLYVTLNWSQFQEAQLSLVSLSGRPVLTDRCRVNGGTRFPYDVAHLPAGLYILSLDTDQHRFTKKLWIP